MDQRTTTSRLDGRRYRGRHRQPTRPVARSAIAGTTAGVCLAGLPVVGSISGHAAAAPSPTTQAAMAQRNPQGNVSATLVGHRLHVRGTATDPDTSKPVIVQVAVNGQREAVVAAKHSGDVFDIETLVPYGRKTIQVNGMNVGAGTGNAMIGEPKTVVSLNPAERNPFGDAHVSRKGRVVTITGSAADPDGYRRPLVVRAFNNGKWIAGTSASPNTHRYVLRATLPYGAAHVGVYAFNYAMGTSHTRLGGFAAQLSKTTWVDQYSGNQRVAASMLASYGWGQDQMDPLIRLWSKESGWRTNAANPSGAYGIPQALPGSKMASAGPDWQSNARTQIAWGLNYIKVRYGSPSAAWAHSVANNWY